MENKSTLKTKLIHELSKRHQTKLVNELQDSIILSKEQAIALYNQVEDEWINRDNYEILQSAVKELAKAVE